MRTIKLHSYSSFCCQIYAQFRPNDRYTSAIRTWITMNVTWSNIRSSDICRTEFVVGRVLAVNPHCPLFRATVAAVAHAQGWSASALLVRWTVASQGAVGRTTDNDRRRLRSSVERLSSLTPSTFTEEKM